MATYIGVDGGGTKTRLLVQRDDEPPRYFEFDQTIRFLENGYEAAASRFIELLGQVEGLEIDDVKSISIGLAGASMETEQRRFEQAIKSLLQGFTSVHVQGDASLSLGAAFGDEPGVIVIAGTGSVAIGKTSEGHLVRVGGWGRLLGDEGSGYAIGLAALRHFVRAHDGRDSGGLLFGALSASLAAKMEIDPRELRSALSRSEIKPSDHARIVFETINDPVSAQIIAEAANDLAEIITVCSKQVKFTGEIRAIGSVISNKVMLRVVGDLIAESGLRIKPLDELAPVEHALQLAKAAA